MPNKKSKKSNGRAYRATGLKTANNKLRKIISLFLVVLVAGVGAYTLFFAKADTLDDGCSGATYTVFMNNECIKVIKAMANNITGNSLDTNNGGFDGPLNDQLNGLNGIGFFVSNGCGAYSAAGGLNTCMYKAMKAQVIKNTTPAPAPAPAPTPAPAPAPADNPVPCKDQQMTVGSTGDCVKLLNASMNVVFQKCYAKDASSGGGNFDTNTRDSIKWAAGAGNLADEAKNNIGTLFAGDKVSSRLWDIITFSAAYYNGGNKCVGTTTTTKATTNVPKTTPNTTTTAPKSALVDKSVPKPTQPAAPPAPAVDCSQTPLKIGSTGDCVKQLKYYLVVLAPADQRETVKGQITFTSDKFDKALDDYLRYLINVNTVVTGLPQGSYNGTVNDVIWNRIKLSAAAASQNDAKAYIAAIKAQQAVEDKAAQEAAAAKKAQDIKNFVDTVAALQVGYPDYASTVPRSFIAGVEFQADASNPVLTNWSADPLPSTTGYCGIIIYPTLDKKSTWWTYKAYSNALGSCKRKTEVKQANKYVTSWVPTSAVSSKLSVQAVNSLTGGNATTLAAQGSYGGQ